MAIDRQRKVASKYDQKPGSVEAEAVGGIAALRPERKMAAEGKHLLKTIEKLDIVKAGAVGRITEKNDQ